jgi:hypothetical protein
VAAAAAVPPSAAAAAAAAAAATGTMVMQLPGMKWMCTRLSAPAGSSTPACKHSATRTDKPRPVDTVCAEKAQNTAQRQPAGSHESRRHGPTCTNRQDEKTRTWTIVGMKWMRTRLSAPGAALRQPADKQQHANSDRQPTHAKHNTVGSE